MSGETNLSKLIQQMKPKLNAGKFVFVTLKDVDKINREDTICEFKEKEGITVILSKEKADTLNLDYQFIACWITLEIHSSLNAVGLTAIISGELTKHKISCNVVAGYYHDHLFVNEKDAQNTMTILTNLSKNYS